MVAERTEELEHEKEKTEELLLITKLWNCHNNVDGKLSNKTLTYQHDTKKKKVR